MVDGPDAGPERAEIIAGAGARPIAEIGDEIGGDEDPRRIALPDRAGDDHVGREAAGGGGGELVGVQALFGILAVIARRNHDHRCPTFTARAIALRRRVLGVDPPSDRLMTLAPAATAASIPARDVVVVEGAAVVFGGGAAARRCRRASQRWSASKATPWISLSFVAAAIIAATAEPWPSSSPSPRLPATSRLAGSIRPGELGQRRD